jgi:endonuclease I
VKAARTVPTGGMGTQGLGTTSVGQCALFLPTAAYPGRGVISEKNRKLFQAGDREDPVDAWERERVRRIEPLQGNTNPFVK